MIRTEEERIARAKHRAERQKVMNRQNYERAKKKGVVSRVIRLTPEQAAVWNPEAIRHFLDSIIIWGDCNKIK